jgi:hypothetical protein
MLPQDETKSPELPGVVIGGGQFSWVERTGGANGGSGLRETVGPRPQLISKRAQLNAVMAAIRISVQPGLVSQVRRPQA